MTKNPLLMLDAVVAVAALVIWLLLFMGWPLGWWLLALFLLAHGTAHAFFVAPGSTEAAAAGKRWGLSSGETRMVGLTLVAVAAIGFLLAGFATLLGSGLWTPLIVVSSLASLVLLAFVFTRQVLSGVLIDVVLLLVAVLGVWHP